VPPATAEAICSVGMAKTAADFLGPRPAPRRPRAQAAVQLLANAAKDWWTPPSRQKTASTGFAFNTPRMASATSTRIILLLLCLDFVDPGDARHVFSHFRQVIW